MKKYLNQLMIEEKLQQRLERVAQDEGFPTKASFIRYAVVQTIKDFEMKRLPELVLTPEEEEAVAQSLSEIERGEYTVLKTDEDTEKFFNKLNEGDE